LSVIGGVVCGAKIMMGIITDRVGSKRTFIVGLGAMTIGFIWLLFSRELWALYLFAVIYAFGYAGGSVVMPTIVAEIFGLGAHGGIFGIVNFSACCGVAVGPMLVGWLYDKSGNYQLAMFYMIAFSVLSLLMTFRLRTGSKYIIAGTFPD
jgi:MFS family permease